MIERQVPAYLGVGSNLEDPVAQVKNAIDALARVAGLQVVLASSLYRSKPLGPQNQPDFINAVVGVLTTLDPHALLTELKSLEAALGRTQPIERWGPRRIDFDILVFGTLRLDTEQLQIPHVGLTERNWVLYPLAEIAPELFVPGLATVRELAARLEVTGLERI